jgi:hypothetical protein
MDSTEHHYITTESMFNEKPIALLLDMQKNNSAMYFNVRFIPGIHHR